MGTGTPRLRRRSCPQWLAGRSHGSRRRSGRPSRCETSCPRRQPSHRPTGSSTHSVHRPESMPRPARRPSARISPPCCAAPPGTPSRWPTPAKPQRMKASRCSSPVPAVERYVDLVSRYKVNHLHLHLTDDQGWRIAIDRWPRLTEAGGCTQVDGGPGGCYTKDEYRRIVDYARARYITVVPEIDMPGHVNSALTAYPELNRDGRAALPYTGIEVGFSSLCVDRELTYTFVDNVIGELAALTPGPYLHVGGDEADATSLAD